MSHKAGLRILRCKTEDNRYAVSAALSGVPVCLPALTGKK